MSLLNIPSFVGLLEYIHSTLCLILFPRDQNSIVYLQSSQIFWVLFHFSLLKFLNI